MLGAPCWCVYVKSMAQAWYPTFALFRYFTHFCQSFTASLIDMRCYITPVITLLSVSFILSHEGKLAVVCGYVINPFRHIRFRLFTFSTYIKIVVCFHAYKNFRLSFKAIFSVTKTAGVGLK